LVAIRGEKPDTCSPYEVRKTKKKKKKKKKNKKKKKKKHNLNKR